MTRVSSVRSRDGVRIAVEEVGDLGAPAVVFVHGFAQSRAIWRSVLEGPLAAELHLVTFDLRGHGDSETPEEAHAAGEWLGADLAAVIDSLDGVAPVVVAWSYGGVVVGESLRTEGSRLGGLLLVAAATAVGRGARALFGPTMLDPARALLSADGATYEAGARSFLGGCAAAPLAPDVFEQAVSEMLRVPAPVRKALLARDEDYTSEIARSGTPLATLHGRRDTVVLPAMSERLVALQPDAQATWLDEVGHLPWIEAPSAFEEAVRRMAVRRRV